MGACSDGQGEAPLDWKSCKVFLCNSNDSKTLSRRIIYALFSKHLPASWGFAPEGLCSRPHQGSVYGPRWGTAAPNPLICPPLEKNLAGTHARVYKLFAGAALYFFKKWKYEVWKKLQLGLRIDI